MKRFTFLILLLAGTAAALHAASVLDVGTDYRIRGISVSNPAYGAPNDQSRAYYSQRILAHVGGRFAPNLEFMTQFQALGVVGSSSTVDDPVANQAVVRPPNEVSSQYAPVQHYPRSDFTPWMQLAYFKASQLYDMPLDLTVGRQPIVLGDGLILADDDLGFTGFRAQARLPWYGLQSDLFTFKVMDSIAGSSDSDIYGLQVSKPMKNIRVQLAWVNEHNGGDNTVYIRPSENASAIQALTPGTPINWQASGITRSFYDARVEGRLLEGGFYKGEFALQNGKVHRDATVPGGDVSLSGYGMLLSAGLYTRFSKYGPIEVHGLFGLGTGDKGTSGTDSSFHPTHGHRVDGLERSGFGELFGASLYDASSSSTNPNGLPPGNSGIRIMGGGVTTHPTSLLSIGIDYFAYDAMEQANATFQSSAQSSGLGSEFDIGIGFAYTSYLTFRGSAAFFSPGGAFTDGKEAHRYLIEARGRF